VLVRSKVLAKDEPAAAAALRRALERDGVTFLLGVELRHVSTLREPSSAQDGTPPLMRLAISSAAPSATAVEGTGAHDCAAASAGAGAAALPLTMECEALLIATGRLPNVRDLGLEIAGIAFDETDGIQIDRLGATTNPSVFAIGDCAAGVPRFTHVAGEMAKLVVQNALFGDTWQVLDCQ
jgi:pyruvate/2-oxoglutarate dehydrogenase complex dihydrolipoamide dehydrogenase (E3) component